jgi:hypothetical protein
MQYGGHHAVIGTFLQNILYRKKQNFEQPRESLIFRRRQRSLLNKLRDMESFLSGCWQLQGTGKVPLSFH